MFKLLRHWLAPHHTNNFRARLLHNYGIFIVIIGLVGFNLITRTLDSTSLHILGFTSSVTIDEVVRATNEERIKAGLKTLSYNEKLADAARRKAANMLEENYWAHNSPSGKTPWVWFTAAGYHYTYAGENLAKDFGSTSSMLNAWMSSPTHRANIVGDKYTEIGIAVVPGSLQGSDTVLVVQLFGTDLGGAIPKVEGQNTAKSAVPVIAEAAPALPTTSPISAVTPHYNIFSARKLVNISMIVLFMFALIFDLVIAENKVLSRRVGKNWAHLVFINVILILTMIVSSGRIN